MLPRKKVDFLVIGAQKAGTSALDQYLRQHPAIEMARQKELHFFDNETVFSKNAVEHELLESQFDWKEGKLRHGESTPVYLYWEPAMKRIREYNPDMKLVAILRNPVDRAFSHWNMEVERGLEEADFHFCINNERERARIAAPFQHRVYSYLDRGRYAAQIRRVYRYFPMDQVLFLKYEEYLRNQQATIGAVFEFLGLDAAGVDIVEQKVFKANYGRSLSDDERAFLKTVFSNDVDEVEQLLGWDCTDWRN